MNEIIKSLKENINIFIFISLICIGLIITFTNLNLAFNVSLSSNNKSAISAMERLNGFPEGLLLISMKNQNEFTENDILKITEWLDDNEKSKTEINLYDNHRISINLNFQNNFDLSNYLKKLFLIPHLEIKSLKIINKEKLIKLDIFFNR